MAPSYNCFCFSMMHLNKIIIIKSDHYSQQVTSFNLPATKMEMISISKPKGSPKTAPPVTKKAKETIHCQVNHLSPSHKLNNMITVAYQNHASLEFKIKKSIDNEKN